MKKLFSIGIAALALAAGTPAMAAQSIGGGGCASDLVFTGSSSLIACYGRYDKNVLNNNDNGIINGALVALDYDGTAISYNAIGSSFILGLDGDAPDATVNFPGLLNGTIFVGIHSGGGGRNGVGNTTTFYKINAVNLDSFLFHPQGASTATLLATVPSASAVPEPSAWALMIVGFGLVGAGLRRRRTAEPRLRLA